MNSKRVSKTMLSRVPLYLNYLKGLPKETEHVSATGIARALGLGEVQVRKDLAQTSEEGKPKRGYPRQKLIVDIESFLNFDTPSDAIVIGAGKLGRALLDYSGFAEYGLNIVAGFDVRKKNPPSESGKSVYHIGQMTGFCKKNKVLIGIITVPAGSAQNACDLLVSCGIRSIWNFAPVHLQVPENVVVQNENLAASLAALRRASNSGM